MNKCNCSYINLSELETKNVLFNEVSFINSSLKMNTLENTYFNKCDFTLSQFYKTTLKGIDFSNSIIDGISIISF